MAVCCLRISSADASGNEALRCVLVCEYPIWCTSERFHSPGIALILAQIADGTGESLRCRIFRILGHPSPKVWPALEQHFHWADNTNNIRLRKPDAGSTSLREVRHNWQAWRTRS